MNIDLGAENMFIKVWPESALESTFALLHRYERIKV
jgi:hypothetical protein